MRLRSLALSITPLLLLTGLGAIWWASSQDQPKESFVVETTIFEKWSPLLGRLEAANPITLRAELDGLSKITWLIEDGTPVEAGEAVAGFDSSELEEKKLTFARDLEIAQAEYSSLTQASLPLELQSLRSEERTLKSEKREAQALQNETQELVDEMLVSEGEMDQTLNKITELDAKITSIQERIRLTQEVLHPALKKTAQARLSAAQTALERIETRLQNTQVLAPSQGTVYLPQLHIDGEHRRLRVGDGLFRNQVFMEIADLTHLVLKSEIGEQDLSGIVPGLPARVVFPAFPNQGFTATISRVGSHPEGNHQRYPIQFDLNQTASALRPGLTAEIEVLEYRLEAAILVPRDYIRFRKGEAEVLLSSSGRKNVTLGDGNAGYSLVVEGLEAGDILLRP